MSPQWAVMRVEGEDGCQKGVGLGVEMRAMEQVEPPLKGDFWVGDRGGEEGDERTSEALRGRSDRTGSDAERERRSWVVRKQRSAERKACVKIVLMDGRVGFGEGLNAGGWKRRK